MAYKSFLLLITTWVFLNWLAVQQNATTENMTAKSEDSIAPNILEGTELALSDNLSLVDENEKEIIEHPDEITKSAQIGVQKAEAAALVWSKTAVYAIYVWSVQLAKFWAT